MQDAAAPRTRQTDLMDPARARALQATLGDQATLQAGDPLPPFFHQVYFWDPQPPKALGEDGHPATGSALIPDFGLPQRMWAGGELRFHAPLRAGIEAEKESVCADVTRKTGASGDLAFVTLEHRISQGGVLRVTERQTLVSREETAMTARAPRRAADVPEDSRTEHPDTTLLFRYSALTFNGHRIHYDENFARGPGGYAGLVVHGPLLAQWMIRMAEARQGQLATFSFRAVAPLMHTETARICARGTDYWVAGMDGRLCMTGQAG